MSTKLENATRRINYWEAEPLYDQYFKVMEELEKTKTMHRQETTTTAKATAATSSTCVVQPSHEQQDTITT